MPSFCSYTHSPFYVPLLIEMHSVGVSMYVVATVLSSFLFNHKMKYSATKKVLVKETKKNFMSNRSSSDGHKDVSVGVSCPVGPRQPTGQY